MPFSALTCETLGAERREARDKTIMQDSTGKEKEQDVLHVRPSSRHQSAIWVVYLAAEAMAQALKASAGSSSYRNYRQVERFEGVGKDGIVSVAAVG